MKVSELRKLARRQGVHGKVHSMKKADLIEEIRKTMVVAKH